LFHVVGPDVPISSPAKQIFLDFGSYKMNFLDSQISNVIKTGPDRPVGPETGHSTGPGGSWNRAVPGTGQKSFKTVVNRIEPAEPVTVLINRPVELLA
jgi:hypothetical protein